MTTYDELEPVIRRASKSVAFQWPGVVEQEDLEQELWAKLLAEPNTAKKVLELERKARDRFVTRMGHQLASQERADYDHFRGAYNYSVKEVKELLSQKILTEPMSNFKAELLDLEDAFEELKTKTPQYVDAISRRYVAELTPDTKAEKNALSRALARLTDEMNKVAKRRFSERHDGPGTRSNVSTEDHYEANEFDFESFASNQGFGWG
ncbi:DNA binding protein [Mycobacterium phage Roary]|nr:DNA binding protein [Mycobacterium phage Roary]